MIKKYFKNGNVDIKLDINRDLYENTQKDVVALYDLYDDCFFIGGGYDCWGYDYAIKVYDPYSGKCYIFDENDAKQFFAGKTVKLYGIDPDDFEVDYLKNEYEFNIE